MSLVIYGDPHGEWRPLLQAVADDRPAAIVILGDCDLVSPLHVELAPVFAAGVEVAYLYGNHEKDLPGFWDNLVGDHPGGLPLRQRDSIFPEDFRALVGKRADILVAHEAPSTHQHGFAALVDLARALRVPLVVHGHHHTSLQAVTPDGIAVIGLGKAEVLRLSAGDLP